MHNNFESPNSRDIDGHWTLLGDFESIDFVNWLITKSGLSNYEIINELEYQIQQSDEFSQMMEYGSKVLNQIPVICFQCGKTVPYGTVHVINRYKTEKHSEVISRSLVGGSPVRRNTSITYIAGYDHLCNECYIARQIIYKNKNKDTGIKGFFKKIFTRHK